MKPIAIYLAGPLFTQGERAFNVQLAQEIRVALDGYDRSRRSFRGAKTPSRVLVPQEFCAPFDAKIVAAKEPDERRGVFANIRTACLQHLEAAELVVAVLDGPDIDSGTAYECGYAYGKGISVVGLRTDMRPAENGTGNCMITAGCETVFTSQKDLVAWISKMCSNRVKGYRDRHLPL